MSDSSDMKGRDALQAAQTWLDRAAELAETDAKADHIEGDRSLSASVTDRLEALHRLAMAQLNVGMNLISVEAADEQNDLNRKAAVAASLGIGGVPVGPSALRQPRG